VFVCCFVWVLGLFGVLFVLGVFVCVCARTCVCVYECITHVRMRMLIHMERRVLDVTSACSRLGLGCEIRKGSRAESVVACTHIGNEGDDVGLNANKQ
jgi:hypothetical protein